MLSLSSFPTDLVGILFFVIGLIILWVIVSIPVYFAGKAIVGKESSFGNAMGATLGGGLAYFIVFFVVSVFLGPLIGRTADALAALLAILVWLAVFRAAFSTSWIKAVGIVIVAWIILIILDVVLVAAFGVKFPNFIPFA